MVEEAIFVDADNTLLLKKAVAKNLYSKKFDQSKISDVLRISQPMISNYCSSDDKIPKNILDLAEKISNKIITGKPINFHVCVSFCNEPFEGNFYVARKNEIISDESNYVIDNLTEAFLLLKDRDIRGLVPEVKINIAMSKDKADSNEDVAAFLNGLIIADDTVMGTNGIRFGKSKHLSSLLIYIKNYMDVNAIMNIAYIKGIEKTGFNYSYLTKDYKLKNSKKNVDIILHKGDFGIEPCSYILGKNAVDVVNKLIKIKSESK